MVLFLGLIDLPHTHIRMVFQEGVKHGLQAFHSGSGGCTGQDAVQRVFPLGNGFIDFCAIECFQLFISRETLIKSLPDFILGFLYRARNHSTRIASYLRRMMTKLCIKIHMKSDSAI